MVLGKQEHAPYMASCSKNPHAVNYCGCQLAQRLGWATPAYHRKEGASLHPGAHMHILQYERRPDRRFWVQVGTWDIDSLSANGGSL